MKLFRVVNQKLVLAKDELLTIHEFKQVMHFCVGMITAEQYFTYLYYYCDYSSPYFSYDDDERHTKAMFEANMPTNFAVDKTFQAAINKYIKLRDTVTIRSLKSAGRALEIGNRVMETTVKNMKTFMQALEKLDITNMDAAELEGYSKKMDYVKKELKYSIGAIDDIQKNIILIDSLTKKAMADDFEDKKASGAKRIGNRAEPKRDGTE